MTFRTFVTAITPTTTEAMNTAYWILLIVGIVVVLVLAAFVLTKIEDHIQLALRDDEPFVDDVTERRRVRAEAFAERQQQLAAAALGRRR